MPEIPLSAAYELLVDPDKIFNLAAVVCQCATVVARPHPGPDVVVGPRDVLACEVDHREPDMRQDIGIPQVNLAGRPLIVPPDVRDAVLRPEVLPVPVKVADTAAECRIGGLLDGIVEEAHGIARPTGRPVFDLAPGTENLREDEGVVPLREIVREQLIGFVSWIVAVVTPQVVAVLGLVEEPPAVRTKELPLHMLACVETQAVVIHLVAQPGDPAIEHFGSLFVPITGGVVRVLVVLAGMPEEGGAGADEVPARRVVAAGETRGLLFGAGRMILGTNIDEADQLLPQRATVALAMMPLVHARTTFVVQAGDVVGLPLDVKVLGNHTGILTKVGAIPVVIHDDVGNDLDIALMGLVHHVAHRAARAVTRG